MPNLSLAEAEDLVCRALVRANTSEDNARHVARALVAAEADGLKGHGLSRVPSYAAQAKVGKVDGHAQPQVSRPKQSVVAVDAAHGFAYPAIEAALEVLPDAVRSNGLAAAAIRRSHHCGAAGLPVERPGHERPRRDAVRQHAGRDGALGWARRASSAPTRSPSPAPSPTVSPFVVDLSLSKVARGNIVAAKQRGEAIPEGWAVDAEGRPTTDADAALKGTMVPLGDAKGTALALMVELLAAGLTGATYASEASSFLDDKGGPPGTGQLILAFEPEAFGPGALGRFARLAGMIEEQSGARLPGQRRLALRRGAAESGVRIPDALMRDIEAI